MQTTNIKRIRDLCGFSQEEISAFLGEPRGKVAMVELNRRSFKTENMFKYAALLNAAKELEREMPALSEEKPSKAALEAFAKARKLDAARIEMKLVRMEKATLQEARRKILISKLNAVSATFDSSAKKWLKSQSAFSANEAGKEIAFLKFKLSLARQEAEAALRLAESLDAEQ